VVHTRGVHRVGIPGCTIGWVSLGVHRVVYAGYERYTLGGVYPVYMPLYPGGHTTLVYMPWYTTLGTPLLHTVWHGQRTRRYSSV